MIQLVGYVPSSPPSGADGRVAILGGSFSSSVTAPAVRQTAPSAAMDGYLGMAQARRLRL
jgi:hypothetical protein